MSIDRDVDQRDCGHCRHWVGHNHAEAHRGECTNPEVRNSLVIIGGIGGIGETVDASAALVTAFDWSCKGWEQRQPQESDAQCQSN